MQKKKHAKEKACERKSMLTLIPDKEKLAARAFPCFRHNYMESRDGNVCTIYKPTFEIMNSLNSYHYNELITYRNF